MSKFKINERVIDKTTGKNGVIKNRNIIHTKNSKETTVEYLVDFGGTMADWKIMTRNQLQKVHKAPAKDPYIFRSYPYMGNSLIMGALRENEDYIAHKYDEDGCMYPSMEKGRKLTIGFCIYNGTDEYSREFGEKLIKHRIKTDPFSTMSSTFSGEFNEPTILAIMDAKASYIMDNWDKFYHPEK